MKFYEGPSKTHAPQLSPIGIPYILFVVILIFHFGSPKAQASTAGSQTFTLDAKLISAAGDQPLLDASVAIDIKILDPSGACILYEETQNVNTTTTEGRFSIMIGSATGASKRVSGSTLPMTTIFQNSTSIVSSLCTYLPVAGDARVMRVTVLPSSTGTTEVLSPDTILDTVPNALVAETLQGLDRDHVLAIDNSTTLSQTNVANIFSATNYPLLTALLGGSSSQYVSATSSGGAKIPSVSTAPSSPAAGQIWFSSSANAFQYYNGSAVQTLGTSGSGLTSVSVSSYLTAGGTAGGTITSSGTIDIVNSGVTGGSYAKVTVNAKGLVTYGTGLAESDVPTLTSAGHVLGDTITSGTIAGSTSFNSTGAVKASTVTSGIDVTKQIQLQDPAPMSTHKISISAPTLANDYSLVFPATAGTAGYALTTDGSGNLSWSSPGSTGLPSLATGKIWIGNSGSAATAVVPFGDVNLSISGSGTVSGLQGAPISATQPTLAGQVLRWSGGAWAPGNIAMTDLRSSITGSSSFTSSCTASQTLTYDSIGDKMLCASIAIANSQMSWTATGANFVFAGPASGGAAAPTFRALTAADLPSGIASQWSTVSSTINYVAGSVGIGTASPQAALDVYGLGTASALLVPRDGNTRPTGVNGMLRYNTVSNAMESFIGGAWTTLATGTGGGSSQWTTSGANIYYGSGNVGIGSSVPVAQLDIVGSARISSDLILSGTGHKITTAFSAPTIRPIDPNSNSTFAIEPTGFATMSNLYLAGDSSFGSSSNYFLIQQANGFTNFNNGSASSKVDFQTGAISRLTIAGGGNIGINTSSPAAILDVVGSATTNSAIIVPRATIAQRPSAPVNGMIRYQTDTQGLEAFVAGAWAAIATGSSGGGGGGTAITCPTNFTAVTGSGAQFCIKPMSQDNVSGQNVGSGSSSNVGSIISNCAGVSGVVCSYAQLYSAHKQGIINLSAVSGSGATYNGQGAWVSETMFYPDAINYQQNSGYCPSINGSAAFQTVTCSQPRSYFCCR